MTHWEQEINWHLNQYDKKGSIYHLAQALCIFKSNMPKYYEQWKNQIIKNIKTPSAGSIQKG